MSPVSSGTDWDDSWCVEEKDRIIRRQDDYTDDSEKDLAGSRHCELMARGGLDRDAMEMSWHRRIRAFGYLKLNPSNCVSQVERALLLDVGS